MKRILCTMIALLMVLTACAAPVASEPESTKYVHTPYVSNTTPDKCFVCGDNQSTLPWGEDNIGILNLNTFEMLHIEINRYENGQLLEKPAGFLQNRGMTCGESNVQAMTNPDRGYSNIQIQGQLQPIDSVALQSNLCQDCLDKINDMYFGDYPPKEYAIVNFADKTLRPLIQSTTFFSSGNYGINCDFEENGEVDLIVFYCPPRYK